MEKIYNRENIDKNLSPGEIGLIYYNDILDEAIMNKIITSTILKLHLKKHIKIEKEQDNAIIILTENDKKDLKISEEFILECLKQSDLESDNKLTIEELTTEKNKVFAQNKNAIKDKIFEEAIADKLINQKEIKKSKHCVENIFRVGLYIIFSVMLIIFKNTILTYLTIGLVVAISIGYLNPRYRIIFNKYIDKNTEKEKSKYLIDSIIAFLLAQGNVYLINNRIEFEGLEMIAVFIFCIIMYIRYYRINIYENKAIEEKEKLKGIANYLKDYSMINEKDVLDIYLWEEYLVYASILGINEIIDERLQVNIKEEKKTTGMQYDYYENRYFYIKENNEKIYFEKEEENE